MAQKAPKDEKQKQETKEKEKKSDDKMEKEKPEKKPEKKEPRKPADRQGAIKYAAAVILVVVIIAIAIFSAGLLNEAPGVNTSFVIFQKNFDSASRVDIFATAYNGTVESGTVGCATAIIEEIIANRTYHRDSNTIDFNIIANQTSCIRTVGPGGKTSNTFVTSLQYCLNTTSTEPTIYINYSANNITIIRPDYLYISGDLLFLRECGVASQIS